MATDDLSVGDVLRAIEERARKRVPGIEYSSRIEIADHLGRSTGEIAPLVDAALSCGQLKEHDRYQGNFELTETGQNDLDSQLYLELPQRRPWVS